MGWQLMVRATWGTGMRIRCWESTLQYCQISLNPVQIGRKKAMWFALVFYLLFIPIYPIPYFGWFGADPVFNSSYFYIVGGTLFAISLLLTWILTYRIVLKGDEEKIWGAFERYERVGTRVMVIFFQVMLLFEAFY